MGGGPFFSSLHFAPPPPSGKSISNLDLVNFARVPPAVFSRTRKRSKKILVLPPPRYLACCERDRGKQILRERSSRNLAIPIFAHDISYPTLTYTEKKKGQIYNCCETFSESSLKEKQFSGREKTFSYLEAAARKKKRKGKRKSPISPHNWISTDGRGKSPSPPGYVQTGEVSYSLDS